MSRPDFKPDDFLKACADGDKETRVKFQDLFGEFIYNYPMKMFHLPKDRAADFYIYVFESDRIFRRLRSFERRNDAQLKTYLNYYVLRDLFFEWQRSQKEPETISLETVVSNDLEGGSTTLHDVLADPKASVGMSLDSNSDAEVLKDFLENLDPEKRLLLKLLHLAEFELSPQEIRLLCKKSGRPYREVVGMIEETKSELWKKDEKLTELDEQLGSIHGWILLRQKELDRLGDRLKSLSEGTSRHAEVRREIEDLERKLDWRYRQSGQLLGRVKQFRITTPYRDIARLLNAPLGTVCSLVARMREDLAKNVAETDVEKQASVL